MRGGAGVFGPEGVRPTLAVDVRLLRAKLNEPTAENERALDLILAIVAAPGACESRWRHTRGNKRT